MSEICSKMTQEDKGLCPWDRMNVNLKWHRGHTTTAREGGEGNSSTLRTVSQTQTVGNSVEEMSGFHK